MHLHEDREKFAALINRVSEKNGMAEALIEKDYYVTILLKALSKEYDNVVFKGGTALSKGYHVINRFSEDIDITFTEHIGEARRKKLKNNILKGISEEYNMPIANWDSLQSDRDLNSYSFSYKSLYASDDRVLDSIKLETALGSYSFPTQKVSISNYIFEYLSNIGRMDVADEFDLLPFEMNLQSLERTYIDKIFALCDYYIGNLSKRRSRHLYDIYKLSSFIQLNESLAELFKEVRQHRQGMDICPSAKEGVDLNSIIQKFCDEDFFKDDYHSITSYFSNDMVEYENTIDKIREIGNWIQEKKL